MTGRVARQGARRHGVMAGLRRAKAKGATV